MPLMDSHTFNYVMYALEPCRSLKLEAPAWPGFIGSAQAHKSDYKYYNTNN